MFSMFHSSKNSMIGAAADPTVMYDISDKFFTRPQACPSGVSAGHTILRNGSWIRYLENCRISIRMNTNDWQVIISTIIFYVEGKKRQTKDTLTPNAYYAIGVVWLSCRHGRSECCT